MVRAIWSGAVLAESDETEMHEGTHYFPPQSIKKEFFKPSGTRTVCPWKGMASYFSIEVDGRTNEDAAWSYPAPKDAAKNIKDHMAFWKGVEVID